MCLCLIFYIFYMPLLHQNKIVRAVLTEILRKIIIIVKANQKISMVQL